MEEKVLQNWILFSTMTGIQKNSDYPGINRIIPVSLGLSREKGGDDGKKGVQRSPDRSSFSGKQS
jgi:hypothetical protein